MNETIYEVVVTSWSTFGDESTYVDIAYDREDSARMHAYLVGLGWGQRAYVRPVGPAEVLSSTPQEVYERYSFYDTKKLSRKELQAIAKGEKTR